MKVVKWLDDHLEETFLVILLILISCVSLLQVIIRKIPFIPALTWAEELCRFLWIWSVFISLPYTLRKNNMLRVGVLMDLLPNVLHKIVNIVVDVVNTACMGLLGYWSFFVLRDIMASRRDFPGYGMADVVCLCFHADWFRSWYNPRCSADRSSYHALW